METEQSEEEEEKKKWKDSKKEGSKRDKEKYEECLEPSVPLSVLSIPTIQPAVIASSTPRTQAGRQHPT